LPLRHQLPDSDGTYLEIPLNIRLRKDEPTRNSLLLLRVTVYELMRWVDVVAGTTGKLATIPTECNLKVMCPKG
jgi:hypothetical protein